MKRWSSVLLLLASVLSLQAGDDPKLALDKKGVEIDAGKLGTFILQAPHYMLDAEKGLKPEFKEAGGEGVAEYPNGAKFTLKIDGNEIACSWKDLPKDGTTGTFKFFMDLPLSLNKGGKYLLGSKDLKPFPVEITTEQFLVTGSGSDSDFAFVDKDGNGMRIKAKNNWFGLQDNRVWSTPNYSYQFLIDPKAGSGNDFKIKVEDFKE